MRLETLPTKASICEVDGEPTEESTRCCEADEPAEECMLASDFLKTKETYLNTVSAPLETPMNDKNTKTD